MFIHDKKKKHEIQEDIVIPIGISADELNLVLEQHSHELCAV